MSNLQTAERVSQFDPSDNFVFQRSLLAYRQAAKMVSGRVLEIGTGSGYGIREISPAAESFITLDKYEPDVDMSEFPNVEYLRMKVPPVDMPAASFDYVVSFQVIEHIVDDLFFLSEVQRVLKPGGKFIVSTPNAKMSLTRNPWHVREYTPSELSNLLGCYFANVETMGVFGNDRVLEYYRLNRLSVERITRFDLLKLQYRLPRWMLKIPYDILNRINRKGLLKNNDELVSAISIDDYRIAPASDQCFDLFYVATKQ